MAVVDGFTVGCNLRWLRHREPSALRVAQLQRETNGSRTCRELSSPTRWGERKGCGRGRKRGDDPSVSLSPPCPPVAVVCFQRQRSASFLCVNPTIVSLCLVYVEQFRSCSTQILKLHEVITQGGWSQSLCQKKRCESSNMITVIWRQLVDHLQDTKIHRRSKSRDQRSSRTSSA